MIKAPPVRKPESAVAASATKMSHAPAHRPNAHLVHAILQRKEDERAHKPGAFSRCESCAGKAMGWLQRKLAIGAAHDPLEREADRVADRIAAMTARAAAGQSPIGVQRAAAPSPNPTIGVPESVQRTISSPGKPLGDAPRQDMEQRFARDFSQVRVHDGSAAAQSAREIGARAYTVGSHIVFGDGEFAPGTSEGRKLLAHELVHTVQQSAAGQSLPPGVQRKVILKGAEAGPKDRATFMTSYKWTDPALARSIMDDMANAGDVFDFANEAELHQEIAKRITTVRLQMQSQNLGGEGKAFGYPFTGQSILYGPRVNWKARDFWTPKVVDDYQVRTDKAKNKDLREKPMSQRCHVYGDPCTGYSWHLSAAGKTDPYNAITYLFAPQPPHKRSLIHCDYVTSMVHFLSFAESIGKKEFNKRVVAFGAHRIVLHSYGFMDLNLTTVDRLPSGDFPDAKSRVTRPALGSLQTATPTSEADLILGDHVIFWNHLAYDLLNEKFGNAWRLENAIVIKRSKAGDTFLGHGSGAVTADQMNAKLAEEYNDVAKVAVSRAAEADSAVEATRKKGAKGLADNFPNVKRTAAGWKVQGKHPWCGTQVDMELRTIWPNEVVGLKNPCDPGKLNTVRRPIQSAK